MRDKLVCVSVGENQALFWYTIIKEAAELYMEIEEKKKWIVSLSCLIVNANFLVW